MRLGLRVFQRRGRGEAAARSFAAGHPSHFSKIFAGAFYEIEERTEGWYFAPDRAMRTGMVHIGTSELSPKKWQTN
jgi:hypothetical protein